MPGGQAAGGHQGADVGEEVVEDGGGHVCHRGHSGHVEHALRRALSVAQAPHQIGQAQLSLAGHDVVEHVRGGGDAFAHGARGVGPPQQEDRVGQERPDRPRQGDRGDGLLEHRREAHDSRATLCDALRRLRDEGGHLGEGRLEVVPGDAVGVGWEVRGSQDHGAPPRRAGEQHLAVQTLDRERELAVPAEPDPGGEVEVGVERLGLEARVPQRREQDRRTQHRQRCAGARGHDEQDVRHRGPAFSGGAAGSPPPPRPRTPPAGARPRRGRPRGGGSGTGRPGGPRRAPTGRT